MKSICRNFKKIGAMLLLIVVIISLGQSPTEATTSKTYTVTANLFVPGHLNTQLPGVTAYLTNGSNPLGIDGYPAVAPTTPVSKNAKLTVFSDGTLQLDVKILNPVFTLQKISGSSNATILSAPKDKRTYTSTDGTASRNGRITNISVKLHDKSGEYVFNNCIEFPTLLGVNWSVPLTLAVDFKGVNFNVKEAPTKDTVQKSEPSKEAIKTPANSTTSAEKKINYDKLKAIINTVNKDLQKVVVSKDGKDVEPSKVWSSQEAVNSLKENIKIAENALTATSQQQINKATETLTNAYKQFIQQQKSGEKLSNDEESKDRELASGTYQVSANIWFNKADTGLPLNPHITNSTFPPYNPVANNASLKIKENGKATVTIPIVIQDKVLTVKDLTGMQLSDVQKNENGAITEITVDLGKLTGTNTVVTQQLDAEIEMGDLAMSISGLTKKHSWPATFELNLSGVATKNGGVMPTVELQLLNESDANNAMALASASVTDEKDETEAPTEEKVEQTNISFIVLIAAIFAVLCAACLLWYMAKRKNASKHVGGA